MDYKKPKLFNISLSNGCNDNLNVPKLMKDMLGSAAGVTGALRINEVLTLKPQAKFVANILTCFFFLFYFIEKISLEISYESSAKQAIHIKS